MRHRTTSPFCITCRLRCAVCACPHAPRLDLATRIILLVHHKEWGNATNTGHLIRLALRNFEVRVHGRRHEAVNSEGFLAPDTLVLFPGRGAEPLTSEFLQTLTRPVTLVVPDGNWIQAKNMLRRVPRLGQVKRVCLAGPELDLRCLRRNIYADRMSTFEAIAQTLGLLEGPKTEERLLDFFYEVLKGRRLHQPRQD